MKWGVKMQTQENILTINGISKSFPGVQALSDVSFNIKAGEVHGLVGENGAGKSTLIKSIMKVQQVDTGEIKIWTEDGWEEPKTALEARRLGLYANYQHVNIANQLSVAENYFLGRMPLKKSGVVDWKRVYVESKKILDRFNLDIDPKTKIKNLPIAMQEMVLISQISIIENLKLVIFDEPTALLENDKVELLFKYIRELKQQGISVIYISHRLEEITEICDRVTVLKDGEFIATKAVSEIDKDILVSLMVGRKVDNIYSIHSKKPGKELLRVENLTRTEQFKNISFNVREGEIVGFFGLVGAGRTEVMRCLYGADEFDSGKVFIKGKEVGVNSVIRALKNGIGLVPEDRRDQGLALELGVKENVNLNSYDMISKFGIINVSKETNRAKEYVDKINIKTPNIYQKVKNLSGGNQQKVVISKLLCRDLDVFIFDEPTVGVDVGAKQEIYRLIEQLSQRGKGVIIISSYLPEVMGLSDRILVMAEGEIVGEVSKAELNHKSEEEILRTASKHI